jgi:hypothetical protein
MAGWTLDLILSSFKLMLFIGDGLIAIRTTIRKFLNNLLFHIEPSTLRIELWPFSLELPAFSFELILEQLY